MTQNQIAYWANVERERSNRRNEEIAQQKADTEELKAKHDIVQGYQKQLKSTPLKATAGAVIAKDLGVKDPWTAGKEQVMGDARRWKKKLWDDRVSTTPDLPAPPTSKDSAGTVTTVENKRSYKARR